MLELKALFFNALYQLPLPIMFLVFIISYFLSLFLSLIRCFSCILYVYLDCVFVLFNEFRLLIYKKNFYLRNVLQLLKIEKCI
jgi:hypothetical protein